MWMNITLCLSTKNVLQKNRQARTLVNAQLAGGGRAINMCAMFA
jgi:hypothetical protein